jgi:hypothetical protein
MADAPLRRKGKPAKPEAERFWPKVQKGGADECWPWLAGVTEQGYGSFKIGSRTDKTTRAIPAHRWAYEHLVGPVPAGMDLDHRVCRNKRCVNPRHLVVCTRLENSSQPDGVIQVRLALAAAQTHCKHGHEFTPENTYLYRGKRNCRICNRGRQVGR